MPFAENSARCGELKDAIRSVVLGLISEGYTHFISGMALGVDTYFAECILYLKADHAITLEAAVPFPGQADLFAVADKARYNGILAQADKTSVISPGYSSYCMSVRNKYMVDSSDVVLSVCFVQSGGSINTARYAKKQGKRIIDLLENF